MSDENRIHTPGRPPDGDGAVKIGMGHDLGKVTITFDPAIVRVRFRPREARDLAMALLSHAQQAEDEG
jgi:hypothetical protein